MAITATLILVVKTEEDKIMFTLSRLQKQMISIGCPVYIINNTIHKGCVTFSINIESIVMKIFNHFSVFTIRTEALKDFCQQSEIEYSKFLYHSKTRWLSLYPAIERILKLYEPLKYYFSNLENSPKVVKIFLKTILVKRIYL